MVVYGDGSLELGLRFTVSIALRTFPSLRNLLKSIYMHVLCLKQIRVACLRRVGGFPRPQFEHVDNDNFLVALNAVAPVA